LLTIRNHPQSLADLQSCWLNYEDFADFGSGGFLFDKVLHIPTVALNGDDSGDSSGVLAGGAGLTHASKCAALEAVMSRLDPRLKLYAQAARSDNGQNLFI
jgi:hypothetical protein